ncbi:UNVERIFIED_CONTAM: hypothetical protein FKN15_009785 [Acipenser sinensis]
MPSWSECHPLDGMKPNRRLPGTDYEVWSRQQPQSSHNKDLGLMSEFDTDSEAEDDALSESGVLTRVCAAAASKPGSEENQMEKDELRSKRRDGKPNSLDLTFHLLREFLEMARAEKMAQKALSNKKLMQAVGK